MSGKRWRTARLGDKDIARTASGGTPDRSSVSNFGGDLPWVKSGELADNVITDTEERLTQSGLENSSAKLFPAGTLLLAMYGATAGRTGILGIEASTNQAVCAIFPVGNSFDSRFLQFQLVYIRPRLLSARSGGAQPNISQRVIATLEVVLPPLDEQLAIARALEAVRHAKEARQHELTLERERKVALMEYLFTRGTRGVSSKQTEVGEIPQNWRVLPLTQAFETQLGKMLSQKARTGKTPKPYLRNANVQWGRVNLSDLYEMDFTSEEQKKFSLRYDDLLVCEGGEIGRAAIWREEMSGCYFQKAIHRLRPRSGEILPHFLLFWMEWAFRFANIYGVTGTKTTIAHLPQDKLEQIKIPTPNKDEQAEAVEALDRCDSKIASVEKEIQILDELFRAMLEGLMTGRLSGLPLVEEYQAR